MGINKLVQAAVTMALLAASMGQLPKVIYGLHVAQIKLLQDFQASKWPKAWVPPEASSAFRTHR